MSVLNSLPIIFSMFLFIDFLLIDTKEIIITNRTKITNELLMTKKHTLGGRIVFLHI
jgi:hypothetical protein